MNRLRPLLLLLFLLATGPAPAQAVFKLPVFSGRTLKGTPVDSLYFQSHLTLLNFFYIGCAPCMKEIPLLNRLQAQLKDRGFRILGIAPHGPAQLRDFNDHHGAGPRIHYDILPECAEDTPAGPGPRCHTISRLFGVSAWPTSVLVNGRGEILMTTEGFPMRENEEETYQEMLQLLEPHLR